MLKDFELKHLTVVILICFIAMTFHSIYLAGKLSENTFDLGLQLGRQQIIDNIVNQLTNSQELRLKVGVDEAGNDQIIILQPVR